MLFALVPLCICSAAPGLPRQPSATFFTSNDQIYCAEGAPRAAEGALAMLKAAPTGGLFNLSSGVAASSSMWGCKGRGYTVPGGADVCTPQVQTFFKTEAGRQAYNASVQTALGNYAQRYQLPLPVAALMAACVCAPNSDLLQAAGGQCTSGLQGMIGAWVHQDPYNGHMLMCDEGPFVFATRALSVLKASPQLAMHMRDQISPLGCPKLGFPVSATPMPRNQQPLRLPALIQLHLSVRHRLAS